MKKFLNWTVFLALSVIFPYAAIAADSVDVPLVDWFGQVMAFVGTFKDLALEHKIAGIMTLVISTVKVSAARELLWDKWGSAKVFVPLVGALVIGVLSMDHVSLKSVLEYVTAVGGGAIVLHQLLDALKSKLLKYQWAQTVIGFIQAVIPSGLQAEKKD